MQPIPRLMLVHDISYEKRTGTDGDGNGVYDTAIPVFFVRCEPVKAWLKANVGEMLNDKLTLFYDCVNSDPLTIVFSTGDKVTFNGQAYTVRESKALYADSADVHHYEVFLQ